MKARVRLLALILAVLPLVGPPRRLQHRSLCQPSADIWNQVGFVENLGQLPASVRFALLAGEVAVTFSDREFTVHFADGHRESYALPCVQACRIVPVGARATAVSWRVGAPSLWKEKIPAFSRLRYEGLENGVSLEFYPREETLEFDVLAPSPQALAGFQIRREVLASRGGQAASVAAFRTAIGNVAALLEPRLRDPRVGVTYRASSSSFALELPDHLPPGPVRVDPTLVWGNYWGRVGPFVDVAVASDGTLLVAGKVLGLSLEDPNPSVHPNVLVAAIAPDRTRILWLTIFGGTWEDEVKKIALAPQGIVYAVGNTVSPDFPLTLDAYAKNNFGARVGFIAGLRIADGSFAVSTFFANPRGVPFDAALSIEDLAVEPAGDLFLAGWVLVGGLPVTPGSFQPLPQGARDWFLARLAPRASSVRWCTYFGGGYDEAERIRLDLDPHLKVVLAGSTLSPDLPAPIPPLATFQYPLNRGYLARFSSAGFLETGGYLFSDHETDVAEVAALDENTAVMVGVMDGLQFPQRNPLVDPATVRSGVFLARLRFEPGEWEQVTFTPVAIFREPTAGGVIELVGMAPDTSGMLAVVGNARGVAGLEFPKAYRCDRGWSGATVAFTAWFDPRTAQLLEGSFAGPEAFAATAMTSGPDGSVYLVGRASYLPDSFPVPGGNDPPCYPPCGRGGMASAILVVRRGDPPFPRIAWAPHPEEIVSDNPLEELELTFRLDRPWPEPIVVTVFSTYQPGEDMTLLPGQTEARVRIPLFPDTNHVFACLPAAVSGCCAQATIRLRRPPRVTLGFPAWRPLYPGETVRATVSLENVAENQAYTVECFADPPGVFQVPPKVVLVGPSSAGPYELEALDEGSARLWCEAHSAAGLVLRSQEVRVAVAWPPPQHLRFLPVAVHSTGLDNSRWRTVLSVFNGYRRAQRVTLRWVQTGNERTLTVPPKGLLHFDDLLVEAFGLDPTKNASGGVLLSAEGKLTAAAQVINDTPRGTYGQSLPLGELSSQGASATYKSVVAFLRGGERFRSNIGVFSTSRAFGCRGQLHVYNQNGTPVGAPYSVELPPLGWQQLNQVLGTGPSAPELGYATLTVEQGSACSAYASIVDRRTGDPTTLAAPSAWSHRLVPVVAQTPGALGSRWASELAVLLWRPAETLASVRVTFHPQGEGEPKTVEISGPSGSVFHFENALTQLLGYPTDARVAGHLTFEPSDAFLAVRLYNLTEAGTLGQEIPSYLLLTTQRVALPGLVHNDAFRTNLGFFVDPYSAQSTTPKANVTFFDRAGNRVGRTLSLNLPPGWSQVNGVLANQGLVAAGYVTAVAEPNLPAWVYASVIDNRSGDPTLVEADPLCLDPTNPCNFEIGPPPP